MTHFNHVISFTNPGGNYPGYDPFDFGKGLHIVAARPLTGKTTLMLQSVLAGRDDAYVYCPEMSFDKLSDRINGIFWSLGSNCSEKTAYVCTDSLSAEQLYEELENVKGTIYIDFLQLLESEHKDRTVKERKRIVENLLYGLGCSNRVIALSSVTADVNERPYHIPLPLDVIYYKDIGRYAETVVTFCCPHSYDQYSPAEFYFYGDNSQEFGRVVRMVRNNSDGTFVPA